MQYLKKIFQFFLSYPCPVCRNVVNNKKNSICDNCLDDIILFQKPICPSCGGEQNGILDICQKCITNGPLQWRKATALYKMKKLGKELIHIYKYSKRHELIRPIALLATKQLQNKLEDIDYIISVPLYWRRKLFRGFNQSDLLAEIISNETGVKKSNKIIKRIRNTSQQALLKKEEREKNLKGAFIANKKLCESRRFLLVDDVMTTGSTLKEISNVLLNAGALSVDVFIIARR